MKLPQTVLLLFVSDMDRSCQFYCQGLGFEMTRRWEPDAYQLCFESKK